jgi:hypothetical protein
MNHAGSQKLIDKRRKMKDTKGTEFAMRVAQESWKGPHRGQPGGLSHRLPLASPANAGRHPHTFMHPSYMGPPMMAHIGYSPMGAPTVTPNFGPPHTERVPLHLPKSVDKPPTIPRQGMKRAVEGVTALSKSLDHFDPSKRTREHSDTDAVTHTELRDQDTQLQLDKSEAHFNVENI